jgi:hypothetical protein
MPAKTRRKTSSSRSGGSKRGAKRSGGARTGRKKRARGTSGTTKTLQKTAVKVMAGAAAGAVRAIIPPLEEAAGTSERAAAIQQRSGSRSGKSGKGRKASQ